MERPYLCYRIGVTGNNPISEDNLKRIIAVIYKHDAKLTDRNDFQPQHIVVGREHFDKDYLRKTVEKTLQLDVKNIYVSQETLLDYWTYGRYTPYYKGDPRISAHPGLYFLNTIGFEWPSTHALPGIGITVDSSMYRDAHSLTSVYGYSVRRDVPEHVRRNALAVAVDPDELGLKAVVYHIADIVKCRKAQLDGRMKVAIDRWEADLSWLKANYYDNTPFSFIWHDY